jgi:hypothetical protein
MTKETLVLVETVLFAVEPVRVSQLRVAHKAAVLVSRVFAAPQPTRFTQRRIADKTLACRDTMCATQRIRRLSCRCNRIGRREEGRGWNLSFGFFLRIAGTCHKKQCQQRGK